MLHKLWWWTLFHNQLNVLPNQSYHPAGVDWRHREFQAEFCWNGWRTAMVGKWWFHWETCASFSWFFTISVIGKWLFFARILLWARMGWTWFSCQNCAMKGGCNRMGFQHWSGPAGDQCFAPRTWLNVYIYIYDYILYVCICIYNLSSLHNWRPGWLSWGSPCLWLDVVFLWGSPPWNGDPMISPWADPCEMVALIASLLVKSP